jgi:hypothetical protein
MIQIEGLCVVISMPIKVNVNLEKRLHSENTSAVEFCDGYSVYAWNGIIIPDKWIEEKENIDSEDIIKETNAEKRRCLREIIGTEKYAKLLNADIIDTDRDLQGNIMNLWRTKEIDPLCGEYLQFYDCICPSTNRKYFLGVTDKCTNVWAAKAETFGNSLIEIRHGDVGLLNLKEEFKQPIFES